MLRQMQRNYTRASYLELVGKLRRTMPEITISTDLIVGFPGETDADFEDTLSLVREAAFDFAFVFKYSPRAGTPAAELESFPDELVEERHLECLKLVEERWHGTIQNVLVEEDNLGRTRGNTKVAIEGSVAVGETVKVRIVRTDRATLLGVRA
jgi:tRNA-2-methylthio-N6-dimethylallyladenosine synthase